MYLHIGKDIVLKNRDILFILDYNSLKENNIFNRFIEKIDKKQDEKEEKANEEKTKKVRRATGRK